MKKLQKLVIIGAISALAAGCTQARLIDAAKSARLTGIFDVVPAGKEVLPGKATIAFNSSVKTHGEGHYLIEARGHGSAEYPMLLSIDGQTVEIKTGPRQEVRPGDPKVDAEAGEGPRYDFAQVVTLAAGRHEVIVALPNDGVAVRREIQLREGENQLVARPVYVKKRKSGVGARSAEPTFAEGVKELKLFLNGQPL